MIIIMAAESTSISQENSQNTQICRLCFKELSKYTCPRCNARYCSTECYKSEGHADCSESFYRNCFMEGLKECEAGEDDKQKMMEMLQRFENQEAPVDFDEDDEDSDDEIALEDRLKGLNLDTDTDEVWEKLTDAERKQFTAMVEDGRLGNMIELWEPWWNVKERHLVEEVGKSKPKSHYPEILRKVPDISKLTKSPPADSLKYDIINILYAYAYTLRLYNGDYTSMELQAADTVLRLSDALSGRSFSQTQMALHASFQAIQKHKSVLGNSPDFSVAVLKDLENILTGLSSQKPLVYIQASLSELYRLFKLTRKLITDDLKSLTLNVKTTKQLEGEKQRHFNTMKKLEYLLGWTQKYGESILTTVGDVQMEFCMMSTDLATQKISGEAVEKVKEMTEKKNKKLIQDISSESKSSDCRDISSKDLSSDKKSRQKVKFKDEPSDFQLMETDINELD